MRPQTKNEQIYSGVTNRPFCIGQNVCMGQNEDITLGMDSWSNLDEIFPDEACQFWIHFFLISWTSIFMQLLGFVYRKGLIYICRKEQYLQRSIDGAKGSRHRAAWVSVSDGDHLGPPADKVGIGTRDNRKNFKITGENVWISLEHAGKRKRFFALEIM